VPIEWLSGGEISFRLWEPSGVFTSELSEIFMALPWSKSEITTLVNLLFYRTALQTQKISHRTHSLVYEIKEASWWLERQGYKIHIMRIPSHVGVMGNERVDRLASEAAQGGTEFAAPVRPFDFRPFDFRPFDFRPLSRARMLDGWQCGRYTYSICLQSH
jgi:hypothetical protein